MSVNLADVKRWVVDEYEKLHREAVLLGDEFFEYVMAENNGRKVNERSSLLFRVRRRGETSLSMCWVYKRFFRQKSGKWVAYSREIPKGRGYETPMSRIRPKAEGWEMDMVKSIEERAGWIRRRQEHLRNIARSLRLFEKAAVEAEKAEKAK